MPLTEFGFKRRTFDEILQDKIAKARELFGEDINTDETTPLGKFIRINAYDQSIAEEEIELVYYSNFPNSASGTSLDRLCVFVGIKRNPAIKAQYIILLTGEAGKVVPKGFLVGTDTNINYSTLEDVTIGDDGTATVTAECVELGEIGNVPLSQINVIVNPSADVDTAIGYELYVKGAEVESDYELRKRYSLSKGGSCNEVAIKSAVLRVPTVRHAGIVQNLTDETDAEGRPARSFECYVLGGENYHKEIAEAIFDKKPIGIKTVGSVSQEIFDIGGHSHIINFSHTLTKPIYVRVAVKTTVEFEGETALKQIKDNLETYIDNVGIGNTLYLSSLFGEIHSVKGVQSVLELQLSTDGQTWLSDNITVNQYENCLCYEVQIKQNDGEYEVI